MKARILDAAYDHVDFAPDWPAPPKPTAEDLSSPAAFRSYRARIIALQPEAEIRATVEFDAEGRAIKIRRRPTCGQPLSVASRTLHTRAFKRRRSRSTPFR